MLDSAVRGRRRPPLPDPAAALPPVASRVGVDRNPLDVTDEFDVRWLRALVWPEHADRHAIVERAVAVAREDPPRLVEGDAVERLPALVDAVSRDRPVCVFDTQMRYQLEDDARSRLETVLAELGAERELHVLSGDRGAEGYEQGLWLTHTTYDSDSRARLDAGARTERVTVYEQHGKWIEWVADG